MTPMNHSTSAEKARLRQEIFDRARFGDDVSEDELDLLTIAQLRELCKEPLIYFGSYGDCLSKRDFVLHVRTGIRRYRRKAGIS